MEKKNTTISPKWRGVMNIKLLVGLLYAIEFAGAAVLLSFVVVLIKKIKGKAK